ncbi:DUF502 domain-containing protein [Lysobacter enzymogenes]
MGGPSGPTLLFPVAKAIGPESVGPEGPPTTAKAFHNGTSPPTGNSRRARSPTIRAMRPPNLQRLFLSGLLTLLPIWLTWVVVKFVFVLLSDISKPLVEPLLRDVALAHPQALGWLGSGWVQTALALIATVAVILLTGALARRVVGQTLLRWFESLIRRIPLASTIYGSARQLLDILQTKPDGTQRVVLVDFPHTEMKSIGFVTKVMREEGSGRELAAVYVPTTPNPTSGYLEIVPVEKITPTDWSVDQAMSFIISGGAVSPATIPFSVPSAAAATAAAPDKDAP